MISHVGASACLNKAIDAPEQEDSAAKCTAEAKSKRAAKNACRRQQKGRSSAAAFQAGPSRSAKQGESSLEPESWPGEHPQRRNACIGALEVQPQTCCRNKSAIMNNWFADSGAATQQNWQLCQITKATFFFRDNQ